MGSVKSMAFAKPQVGRLEEVTVQDPVTLAKERINVDYGNMIQEEIRQRVVVTESIPRAGVVAFLGSFG